MELVKLHEHSDLLEDVMKLLNQHWPRNEGSRRAELNKSCDALPLHLVLIRKNPSSDEGLVVGHSSLIPIEKKKEHDENNEQSNNTQEEKLAMIESVIVDKSLRGKGYGKQVMIQTEEFAKQYGITTLYLSTKDQQKFYESVGFVVCEPITSLSLKSSSFDAKKLSGLLNLFGQTATQENLTWMKKVVV